MHCHLSRKRLYFDYDASIVRKPTQSFYLFSKKITSCCYGLSLRLRLIWRNQPQFSSTTKGKQKPQRSGLFFECIWFLSQECHAMPRLFYKHFCYCTLSHSSMTLAVQKLKITKKWKKMQTKRFMACGRLKKTSDEATHQKTAHNAIIFLSGILIHAEEIIINRKKFF